MSSSILVVDDHASIRRSLRSLLEHHGEMTVCGEAENGAVAIEKVKELHPDVVILDFQMPVMNGLEAAREIALMAPETAMVMLTLHTHEALSEEAKAAGIIEVLSKADAIPQRLMGLLKTICASKSGSQVLKAGARQRIKMRGEPGFV
jgi:DNA-binding NarL/FixJ family response regulator